MSWVRVRRNAGAASRHLRSLQPSLRPQRGVPSGSRRADRTANSPSVEMHSSAVTESGGASASPSPSGSAIPPTARWHSGHCPACCPGVLCLPDMHTSLPHEWDSVSTSRPAARCSGYGPPSFDRHLPVWGHCCATAVVTPSRHRAATVPQRRRRRGAVRTPPAPERRLAALPSMCLTVPRWPHPVAAQLSHLEPSSRPSRHHTTTVHALACGSHSRRPHPRSITGASFGSRRSVSAPPGDAPRMLHKCSMIRPTFAP